MISRLEILIHGFWMMYEAKRELKCVECCVGLGSPRSRQRASLVAQWLGIRLPMQGTCV